MLLLKGLFTHKSDVSVPSSISSSVSVKKNIVTLKLTDTFTHGRHSTVFLPPVSFLYSYSEIIYRRQQYFSLTSAEFVYVHLQEKMMEDEQLIELVRSHTVLYDLSSAKYIDTNFKQAIWKKKLARKMKAEGRLSHFLYTHTHTHGIFILKIISKYLPVG